MNPRWAIISSHYMNAWSLADGIRASRWPTRVVCLKRTREGPVLMELFGRGVEVWETDFTEPNALLNFLSARIPQEDEKALFYTEERYLETVAAMEGHPWLANAKFFPRSMCSSGTILDRLAFYDFLNRHKLGEVPRTIPGDRDPVTVLGDEFFLRFRRSWSGVQRLPRIELVRGRKQLDASLASHREAGYSEQDWCFQEKLSVQARDNVSVCGWHDETCPTYVATRKVFQHPPRHGNGDLCEVIPLPQSLTDLTRRLLDALHFSGPFELEFVRDTATGVLKVIELNPRFWMQHGLVGAATGNALVLRYLGLEAPNPGGRHGPSYWFNSIYTLSRLLRLDLRPLGFLRRRNHVVVPPWGVAVRHVIRQFPALAKRALGRRTGRANE